MKRNGMLFMYLLLLLLLVLVATWLNMNCHKDAANFILSALTAVGTCGVVCFNVFPYKPQDKLSASLYYEPDDNPDVYKIKVINKSDHTISLGLRKDYAPYPDNVFLWWPNGVEKTYEKARTIWSREGDVLSIPPKSSTFYFIDKGAFAGVVVGKITMQVQTNTGYKCDVENLL